MSDGDNRENQIPWGWQLAVAGVLLVLFIVLVVWMLGAAGSTNAEWKNRVFVFGSVEALVFTAIGWVFGREVHRAQVETAREDAEQAKTDAKEKTEEAAAKAAEAEGEREKGKAFAAAVELTPVPAPPPSAGGQGLDAGLDDGAPAPGGPTAAAQLDSLRALARRLYG